MTSIEIAPGQLVRYRETKSRWYLAVVRHLRGTGVELQFFDGTRTIVPAADVEPLETFFDRRDRAWSRTRAQLSEHFYGREIQRLRPARFREMKRALTRAEISIEPQEWPTAETRIRLWRDSSFVQNNGGDPELVALLPQWIEPFVLPSGSRDPLGLQAPAERLVNEVLPGLTLRDLLGLPPCQQQLSLVATAIGRIEQRDAVEQRRAVSVALLSRVHQHGQNTSIPSLTSRPISSTNPCIRNNGA